jgi:hypothetical protein
MCVVGLAVSGCVAGPSPRWSTETVGFGTDAVPLVPAAIDVGEGRQLASAPLPQLAAARIIEVGVGEEMILPQVHVVSPGETLFSIASMRLGSGGRWRELVEANPEVDPGRLRVGQELALP